MKRTLTLIIAVLLGTFAATTATAQDTASFEVFLQQFPKASLPFSLSTNDMQATLKARAEKAPATKAVRLGWEFYGFLPTLEANAAENRMPVYPEPVAMIETDSNYAVIFNTGRAFARQYKTYNIAVFSKDGKHINTRCIAGVNPTSLAAATIDANLNITIQEYSVNWVKDYITNGIEGNQIKELQPIGTRTVSATAATEVGDEWKNQPAAQQVAAALTAQSK